MTKCKTTACLEAEKKRLLTLIKKQSIEKGKIRRAKEREMKLKRDVARLKAIASKNRRNRDTKLSRAIAKARSPETKAKLRRAKSKTKKAWAAFQRFADKYGD